MYHQQTINKSVHLKNFVYGKAKHALASEDPSGNLIATLPICLLLFKNNNIVHGLKKGEFKDLCALATKELYFIFKS